MAITSLPTGSVRPNGHDVEAFVARPDDATHPGVLMFIDAIGMRPEIERIADRIAGSGYLVLVPNVFYRTGTAAELAPTQDLRQPGARDEFFQTIGPRMSALTAEASDADTDTYLRVLRGLPGVADGPVGTVGFCIGARLATRFAGRHPGDVAAVGGFHAGGLATDRPDSPHHLLAHARAEFVYGHADNDPSMPPEAIAELDRALRSAGLTASNEVYPGAPHGFTMSDTTSYDADATERAFAQLRDLFARTLG